MLKPEWFVPSSSLVKQNNSWTYIARPILYYTAPERVSSEPRVNGITGIVERMSMLHHRIVGLEGTLRVPCTHGRTKYCVLLAWSICLCRGAGTTLHLFLAI